MVPKAGLEPAQASPTTPSRWRVYQFHHFGNKAHYFLSVPFELPLDFGASFFAGAGAFFGTAGALCFEFIIVETELLCLPLVKASSREVSMKITAAATVTLFRKGADPWLPKTVWLAPAPNAAPMSLPRPV